VNDIEVDLINYADQTKNKKVNVVAVDDALKKITVKFGGAWSGNYRVEMKSLANGSFKSFIELKVVGRLISFSPTSGSIYGGTLITIIGENFSNDP